MSASSSYQHFKRTTSTTPLQYQKELRLLEAIDRAVPELLVRRGDVPRALDVIAFGVDHGLHDRLWCERCPVLAPLHDDPRFRELATTVAARAREVVAAFRAALGDGADSRPVDT